jgi:hypothetical protein
VFMDGGHVYGYLGDFWRGELIMYVGVVYGSPGFSRYVWGCSWVGTCIHVSTGLSMKTDEFIKIPRD